MAITHGTSTPIGTTAFVAKAEPLDAKTVFKTLFIVISICFPIFNHLKTINLHHFR